MTWTHIVVSWLGASAASFALLLVLAWLDRAIERRMTR